MQTHSFFSCHIENKNIVVSTSNTTLFEPLNYNQVKQHFEWCNAMKDEYYALIQNNTWTVVPYPPNINLIDNKWVYKIKRKANSSIACYKTHLATQGYA